MKAPLALRLLVLSALAACLLPGCGQKSGVIAEAGDERLSRPEWDRRTRAEHGAEALELLVDKALVDQAAEAGGIVPDEARVGYKLDQKILEAGGRAALEQKLAARGTTLDELREELAQEALAEQVMAAEVDVSDEEIEQYYSEHQDEFRHGEMVKGRFMLLGTRANAEAILTVLAEPDAVFAGLAKELSIDPGTKDDGGDMGWIERDNYTSEITDAAFACEVGKYTDIIEYPDGFGIVLVEDRKPPGLRPLEDVRGQIEATVHRAKVGELRPSWAAEQRAKAEIKVLDPHLREAYERLQRGG